MYLGVGDYLKVLDVFLWLQELLDFAFEGRIVCHQALIQDLLPPVLHLFGVDRWFLLNLSFAVLAVHKYFYGEYAVFSDCIIDRLLVELVEDNFDNLRCALRKELPQLALKGLDGVDVPFDQKEVEALRHKEVWISFTSLVVTPINDRIWMDILVHLLGPRIRNSLLLLLIL